MSTLLASRSTSGKHSRLVSAGLGLLAARLAGAGRLGLLSVLAGTLMSSAKTQQDAPRQPSPRR